MSKQLALALWIPDSPRQPYAQLDRADLVAGLLRAGLTRLQAEEAVEFWINLLDRKARA